MKKSEQTRLKNLRIKKARALPFAPLDLHFLKKLEAKEREEARSDRSNRVTIRGHTPAGRSAVLEHECP